jgi:polysaccharide pyruvyl transferase WcaK-like protein
MVLRHNSDISPYASAVKSLVGIAGGKAVVLPFQPSKDGKISIGLSRAAPEYVGLGIWHDLQSLLCQFDECRFVISGRYHALVLAAMRGIPAVCVSDDDKLIRIARDFDYPVLRPSDNFDGSALVAVAERIWKYREILKPGLLRKSAIQATLARNNSALL